MGKQAVQKQKRRQAREDEVGRMTSIVRWAYDRGMPVVYWPLDDVITTLPAGKRVTSLHSVVVLQLGVVE